MNHNALCRIVKKSLHDIPQVSFLAAYPAIKPKGAKAHDAGLNIFGWIIDNFPWVLLGIAALCFVLAMIGSAKRHKEYNIRVEKLRAMEAEQARKNADLDLDSYRHQQFMKQQRALMNDSLRYDILKRDGFRCKICGASSADGVKLHVDHIIPVSKGGRTEPGNLQTLCERCNLGKGTK